MSANNITIYVGDITEELANRACRADPGARLIDKLSKLTPGTYYVSLGDINSLYDFGCILQQADSIVYSPPAQWTDTKLKTWTEDYLCVFADRTKGFDIQSNDCATILNLVDQRHSDQAQLWSVGCSITYGVGVDNDQRYGQLLANSLHLPVSFLAQPGASISWAADQILRSDIRAGDTVVWGLTSIERFPYFKNNQLTHVTPNTYALDPKFKHRVDISFLDSQQLIYQAVVSVNQVINFCKKIGARLILAQLFGRGLERYLTGYPDYIMLTGQFGRDLAGLDIDKGTDNAHPGPKMHQWYHDQIIKKFYE